MSRMVSSACVDTVHGHTYVRNEDTPATNWWWFVNRTDRSGRLAPPATKPARHRRTRGAAPLTIGVLVLTCLALATPALAASSTTGGTTTGGSATPAPDPAPTGGAAPDPAPVKKASPPKHTATPVQRAPVVQSPVQTTTPAVARPSAAPVRTVAPVERPKAQHRARRHTHPATAPRRRHHPAHLVVLSLPVPEVAAGLPAAATRILDAAAAPQAHDSSSNQPIVPAAIALLLLALASASLLRLTGGTPSRPRWR